MAVELLDRDDAPKAERDSQIHREVHRTAAQRQRDENMDEKPQFRMEAKVGQQRDEMEAKLLEQRQQTEELTAAQEVVSAEQDLVEALSVRLEGLRHAAQLLSDDELLLWSEGIPRGSMLALQLRRKFA